MEEQPSGKDAAPKGQKHLQGGQSPLMNGRFAFWAALRLGSHGPSPGQSRTKKVLLFNRYATEQNSFCCSFLASPGPRLRAAGPPPSCAGGLARLPGACPACGPLPGASPVGAPGPLAVPPAPSRVRAAFAVLPAAPPGRRRAGAPRRCGPTVPPADSAAKIRHAALDKARDSRYT